MVGDRRPEAAGDRQVCARRPRSGAAGQRGGALELAIKFRAGKWAGAGPILENLDEALTSKRLAKLPISLDHARRAGLLAWQHRDPFDRMLAAQAQAEGAALVTGDPVFGAIDVAIVW